MNAPADRAVAGEGARLAALTESLLRDLRALAADHALLAVLDARRAAIRLGWLLAGGLMAAVLAVSAWMAFVVAAVVAITGDGASWDGVLAAAALVNVAGAVTLALWIRHRMRELPFAATLRQLRGDPPQTTDAADHARA